MRKWIAILMITMLLASCTNVQPANSVTDNEPEKVVADQLNIISGLKLTTDETEYLNQLKEKGVLKVASRAVATVFSESDGVRSGFNYSTIKTFTDELGIELDVKVVDTIEAFFRKDGKFNPAVKTDSNMIYKPDLFDEVDLYVDTLTQLPWREKLMDFIGFTPVRELVLHTSETTIDSVYDFNGKTIAVQAASSYETTFTELEAQYGIEPKYIYTDTIFEAVEMVSAGKADLTIMDSNRAFLDAAKFDNIEVGIPVTTVKFVGWAVSKDSPELKSILSKYVDALIDEGTINDLWLKEYDISFYEYYTLLLKDASIIEAMNLTAEELEYINALREKGTLRFAMQPNVVGYIFENGEPTGYNYLLARDLTDVLGVQMKVVVVDQFTRFFWKDGSTPEEIKTNPNFFYVPDLFDEVDIYADNFTHLPWRKQILNQIEAVPVSTVVVVQADADVKGPEDLIGMRIALNRDTAYEIILDDMIETYDLQIEIMDVFSDEEGYMAVAEGKADFTIVDSDIAFLLLQDYDGLEVSFQASGTQFLGWAVKKEDVILASILKKYIDVMQKNGLFDQYWQKTYGVSYPEYMRLLTD